jgi:hypothetical protein
MRSEAALGRTEHAAARSTRASRSVNSAPRPCDGDPVRRPPRSQASRQRQPRRVVPANSAAAQQRAPQPPSPYIGKLLEKETAGLPRRLFLRSRLDLPASRAQAAPVCEALLPPSASSVMKASSPRIRAASSGGSGWQREAARRPALEAAWLRERYDGELVVESRATFDP